MENLLFDKIVSQNLACIIAHGKPLGGYVLIFSYTYSCSKVCTYEDSYS